MVDSIGRCSLVLIDLLSDDLEDLSAFTKRSRVMHPDVPRSGPVLGLTAQC
jgi:hypothetical protein